jgi:methionyl-tRNA formyltransferase
LQPATLKSNETLERVIAVRADAMVVAAYGLILPVPYLAATVHGALNIHGSLLPRWRGAAPIHRALLAGDAATGVSIMQMDAGLDTGALLAQQSVVIGGDDDAGTLHDKLASLGAEMMLAVLARLQSGPPLDAVPQPQSGVSYAHKVEKKEALLDWLRPAQELERQVRAFRPSPGASTMLNGEPLKVWRARVRAEEGAPGTLLCIDEGSLVIGCGRQALEVTEIQRPGGRRLATADFLRGRELEPGTRFG